jgi:dUTP pyrophosphatase
MALRVKKLVENAQLPTRGSPGAVGYDLTSTEGYVVLPGKRAVVSTGISIQLPPGVYGRVAPRSGLAVKNGLQVGAGVIDPDYTGEIKIVIFNHDDNPFVIKPGYRIAQLILECCETPEVEEVTQVDDTERGEGGFGSTGYKNKSQ